ncbi:MAG TPA: hypothetical protein QF572_07030 [Vicinamibacterales bacterium]|jgi:hypothetical protein|nr:hypothetical protein [Vicinamibacterales bacterium]HJN43917.1 hypothetical protein [Vicinamibacterales bacterium]|tara:strand:+ start:121 stop:273 length:153 start_codon:yes stop_codon:yes gene_type:complete
MTLPTGETSGTPSIIDTTGDKNFTPTYIAVALVEVIVLAALWAFSRYFVA